LVVLGSGWIVGDGLWLGQEFQQLGSTPMHKARRVLNRVSECAFARHLLPSAVMRSKTALGVSAAARGGVDEVADEDVGDGAVRHRSLQRKVKVIQRKLQRRRCPSESASGMDLLGVVPRAVMISVAALGAIEAEADIVAAPGVVDEVVAVAVGVVVDEVAVDLGPPTERSHSESPTLPLFYFFFFFPFLFSLFLSFSASFSLFLFLSFSLSLSSFS
jgi:hypothetical protein